MAKKYEEEYLDLLLKDMGKFRDLIHERISELEKHKYFDIYRSFAGIKTPPIELNNIAITYNNKLVELYNLYESKGMSFIDSDLIPVILSYFRALLDDVTYYLDMLDNEILSFRRLTITPKVFFKRFVQPHVALLDGILIEFANIDNEIANFSIEKEFKELLETEKDYIQAREEYANPDHKYQDAVLHNCRVEYALLGYSSEKGERYPLASAEKEMLYAFEVRDLVEEKKAQLKAKYKGFPYFIWALNNCLDEFNVMISEASNIGVLSEEEKTFEEIKIRIKNFDETTEIVDALGKIIVTYELNWDLETISQELVRLGLASKYDELVQKLNSGAYTICTEEVGMRKSFKIES